MSILFPGRFEGATSILTWLEFFFKKYRPFVPGALSYKKEETTSASCYLMTRIMILALSLAYAFRICLKKLIKPFVDESCLFTTV
jgi:hypothetical protein